MQLTPGTRLGPYEIEAPLGSGGMGEVYRARDPRLRREVAVKVLPLHLAADPEALFRFEQESRAAGGLNHPGIVTVYDVGSHGDAPYVVTELLEGATLGDRLRDGRPPLWQALDWALQVARGLAAAHEKGIVHRDLKPANVFITHDGRAKILDFGLAKLTAPVTLDEARTAGLPPATQEGRILGTLGYMSPEQVRGRPADHRSDLFSFGAVLFEMVTGARAFQGDTAADTLSAILNEPPGKRGPHRDVPPAVERVLFHCLEKRPEDRFQSARDLVFALESLAGSSQGRRGMTGPAWRLFPRRLRPPLLPVALALLGVLAGWVAARVRPSPSVHSSPLRLAIAFSSEEQPARGSYPLALSRDGRRLVYAVRSGEATHLFLRSLDQPRGTRLEGTEGASSPFLSPDGQWVAFFAGGKLRKMPLTGGAPTVLCDAPGGRGGAWSEAGLIVIAPGPYTGLFRIPAAGGILEPFTKAEGTEVSHRWPEFLPGGRIVVFTAWAGGSWDAARLVSVSVSTGERRVVVEGGTSARYSRSGHLLFGRGAALLALPFDPRHAQPRGVPVPVAQGVETNTYGAGAAEFAVSDDGMLVYLAHSMPARTLARVDRAGRFTTLPAPPRAYQSVAVGPGGDLLAVAVFDGARDDIWTYHLERGTLTRLTFEGSNVTPVWSPDGGALVFASYRGGEPVSLFRQPSEATGPVERLTRPERGWQWPTSWSRRGDEVIFHEQHPVTRRDIWRISPRGGPAAPILRTPFDEWNATLSPDGAWLAYASDVSARPEIYVQQHPGPGARYQVSTGGGTNPAWSPDGRELFYTDGERFLSVSLRTGPVFSAGAPRMLFELAHVTSDDWRTYDVAPDGSSLIVVRPSAGEAAPRPLTVLLGWEAALGQ